MLKVLLLIYHLLLLLLLFELSSLGIRPISFDNIFEAAVDDDDDCLAKEVDQFSLLIKEVCIGVDGGRPELIGAH